MQPLEKIALGILEGDALEVRSLLQQWLAASPRLCAEPEPSSCDPKVRAVAAGVLELLCERLEQRPPSWVAAVEPLRNPVYLVKAALKSDRMRTRVENESPPPLRKRNLFAPPGYLELI